ncbi:MAG: hypothetical protein L0Z53_25515 [Acidobacteriales bacterium]|nr:hypothetical protein [Terriglobales bacterium]
MTSTPQHASPFTAAELAVPAVADRVQRRALLIGIVGVVGCIIGAVIGLDQFLRSYLLAYMLWLGLSLGAMALLMLQYLSGGNWGFVIRRPLEAATRNLPYMAVLFLPLLFGMKRLYPWAQDGFHEKLPEAQQHLWKWQSYLQPSNWIIRAIIVLVVWNVIAFFLNRWSRQQDDSDESLRTIRHRFQALSGPGMVLYGLTITFAAVDWVMSLSPQWFSTIYGMIFMIGEALLAFCFMVILLATFGQYRPLSGLLVREHFHDIGKLILACVLLWSYFSFSQLLIIWSANLPEEVDWFAERIHGGWGFVAAALILFHFALPFLLLLSRDLKRDGRKLMIVAVWLFIMRYVDLFWYVAPNFAAQGHHYSWKALGMDLLVPVAMGGLWLALFVYHLKARPLFPLRDHLWAELMKQQRMHEHT